LGQAKGRLHTGRTEQGKQTENLNMLMCSLYRNEYRNLKLVGVTMGRGLGQMKRTRGDEPVEVVIHVSMEIS
jgi:hypothetical protein